MTDEEMRDELEELCELAWEIIQTPYDGKYEDVISWRDRYFKTLPQSKLRKGEEE